MKSVENQEIGSQLTYSDRCYPGSRIELFRVFEYAENQICRRDLSLFRAESKEIYFQPFSCVGSTVLAVITDIVPAPASFVAHILNW